MSECWGPPPCLTINGVALTQVQQYKYLGVTITSDLLWIPHVTNLCNKTRRFVGLLYRRFYMHARSSTLLKLYTSFIWPHLEYSSAVWNPYLKGEIEAIEKVQKYTVAQKGHVYYQFQHFQLPILNFLIINFQYGYFSLPILNFLVSDF